MASSDEVVDERVARGWEVSALYCDERQAS